MARPIKYNWEDIKKHYEAGMSQTDIVLEFECPKSSLSERIKKENWIQNEQVKDYIKGSVKVNEQKSNIIEQDVRLLEIADTIINDESRRRGLIFNATEKLLKKASQMIDKNSVVDKINVGDGVQNFEPRELNTSDFKNLIDTIDKASITLGINPRHANTNIKVDNNNLQQTNLTIEDISLAIANGLPD